MNSDRRSILLLALIVAVPFFLFFSFQAAFHARNQQRAVLREAQADADLLVARADGVVLEARARLAGGDAGVIATALDHGDACRCVIISSGAARPVNAAASSVQLDNAAFRKLLPVAHGAYEVSALVDSTGHFVARSIDDSKRFATPGSIYLRRAVASTARRGVYSGQTLEGVRNYTSFARSDLTGWSAHVALPAQRIDSPQALFWTMIGLAVMLSLLLAGLLYYVARQQIEMTRTITRRAQESQKMEALGQLTGGMAHDFNNLLTPIVGALDRLVISERLNERERRFARGALESAERAATLTKQLLGFSRRQKLEVGPVDVARALGEVCGLAGPSVGPNFHLQCDVDAAAGCVATDKVQFELATLNLVLNARDAMRDGGAITIRAEPGDEPGWLKVSVSDHGAGMDEATLRRAREPFFTTKAQGLGTGLGLAQVAEVIAQSGGRLEIDSEAGSGTTVTMWLRSVDAPAATAGSVASPARLRPLNLLIVDDEASVRETLVQMVEGDGHVVESVANGKTALAALDQARPDLLLCDFAMPGLNGAEVVARARQRHPGLACLLITGYWDSDVLAEAGVDCHILRKPFTQDNLREAMRQALADADADAASAADQG